MYIVGFNGPPQAGKDTLSRLLSIRLETERCNIPVKEENLSLPLRYIAHQLIREPYSDDTYEEFKNNYYPQFGVTGRQLMIDISEHFLKTQYGQSIMVKMLIERNKNFNGLLLIRDCGFQCEVDPLIEWVAPENIVIVQVARPGKDFNGDSREWVSHKQLVPVINGGDLDRLNAEAFSLYVLITRNYEWKL